MIQRSLTYDNLNPNISKSVFNLDIKKESINKHSFSVQKIRVKKIGQINLSLDDKPEKIDETNQKIDNNDDNNKNIFLNHKRKSPSTSLNDIHKDENKIKKNEEIIISEEPEINIIEKLKDYDTSYDKLSFLSKEIGLETLIDYIIKIINNNSINPIDITFYECDNIDLEKEIKEILKHINEASLYAYLMKILALEQQETIETLTDFKLSVDSKLRSRASIQSVKISTKFVKRKKDDTVMEAQTQYRSKHFYNLNGSIYCYVPKGNKKTSQCFLYCYKHKCKAKFYLDMEMKKGKLYGRHYHEGVDIEKYEKDFPEIKEKNWEHLQYDIKDKKNIFIWKS